MSRVIQHSQMHHLADDTNLLYSSNSMKKINRYINDDLKLTVHWLRVNRISLNVNKTEIIIFRPKGKDVTKKLNFRISGQQCNKKTKLQNKWPANIHLKTSEVFRSYVR